MGLFDGLTDTTEMEQAEDRLGGGFQAIPTDVYDATVKVIYGITSKGGAKGLTVVLDVDGNEVSETIYYTKKTGENFYIDKKTEKRTPLPGFTTVNDLALLITGHPLSKQETEEKIVKIYDFESRKELPTPVQVLTALTGKAVKLGIQREIVDKNKQNDAGQYVPTGETRTQNTISKVFHAETGKTVPEFEAKVEEAVFMEAWQARYGGKDKDSSTGASGAGGGNTGSGRPGGGSDSSAKAESSTSLFG
jgi:hypothetical protein